MKKHFDPLFGRILKLNIAWLIVAILCLVGLFIHGVAAWTYMALRG